MPAGESPAVARHRLRHALRQAREAKRLTQGRVAKELDWSLSKVNRIEAGDVTVSRTDLQAMLQLYEVTDPHVVKELIEEARTSRRRSWWDEPRYRRNLTPALIELMQFEVDAKAIYSFQPTIIPGMLQTRTYAEAVLDYWRDDLSEAQRSARVDIRGRRRQALLNRSDPPTFRVILDESALWRVIGGPDVMADQLEELAKLARRPGIAIRIVPLAEGAPMVMLGAFHVCDVGGHESILYRESHLLDAIDHTPEEVERHQRIFERTWQVALPEEASGRRIEARAATLQASTEAGLGDRPAP
jgi:transcriptional regulator with XRE-family HTH domain